MDNYSRSRDRAQAYFLNFDLQSIINKWNLTREGDDLPVRFFGREYTVKCSTGMVLRPDGTQAEHNEVLTIFDLLCHEGEKTVTGVFAAVNNLRGLPKGAGVGTDFHTKHAAGFDRDPDGFREACLALGGQPVEMGDMGFRFPMFGPLSVILKFYHSDEEFPASVTLLWEENILQFLYYETVFYAAGFLLESIMTQMKSGN